MKERFKSLIQIKTTEKLGNEVFNEEYVRVSQELIKLREKKSDLGKNAERIEEIERRIEDIRNVISEREELLKHLDEEIFNALIDKMKIISKTHFYFVLKNRVKIEKCR